MSDIFTDDDYVKILQNRFETKNIEFLKAEREPLSTDVKGYTSEHFYLTITYKTFNETGKENFFVKTLPIASEYQKKLNDCYKIYNKEIFIYNNLFEELKKYGYENGFFPRCYYLKNQRTIVLENMTERDFKPCETFKFFDVEHCQVALKALANYHANSIVLEETKSKQLGRPFRMYDVDPEAFNEVFFNPGDTERPTSKFLIQSKTCFKTISRFVSESEEWKRKYYEKLDRYDCATVFHEDYKTRKTCCHGDLWTNNLLFKYKNDVPIKCCLIDFQVVRHHYPVYDVMFLIHSNTSREFRKKHFRGLMRFYHRYFCGILRRRGLDGSGIMPEGDFFRVGKALESVAVFQAGAYRSFCGLSKDIINNLFKQDSKVDLQVLFEEDRSDLVIESCKRDEKLKMMMIELVYDLYECL